ncbi:MAG: hypothetical protein IH944_00805 [Armatimonadetes bacterium]|nr:hypothetical protein [Armatimonadota bacterium]
MLATSLIFSVALVAAPVAQDVPKHVVTTQANRLEQQSWKDRHAQKVEVTKAGGVELAFLGDSITHSWENGGKPIWDRYYSHRKAANFGFSGDRTEHVLWRLDNGELISLQPKVVVIMIGTNNMGHGSSTPQMTADGVRAIVNKLQNEINGVKILLLGVFPRSLNAGDKIRKDVAEATRLFSPLGERKNVEFLDIGKYFLRPSGEIRTTMMPDRLHPNVNGYEIWAQAIERTLSRMLGG